MRWLMIALAVVALGLVGAGCGGGDDEAGTDTDTVTITDTTETEDTTDETTTDETDTDIGTDFDFASEDCQELVSASAALSQAFSGAGDDLSDESQQFQEFADNVPEEIRADVQVLADAFAEYAEALSGMDLQAGETPTPEQALELTQALSTINQAEVTAASERLSAWTQENCTG